MRIDKSVESSGSWGAASYKVINYFLDFSDQMGIIMEVTGQPRPREDFLKSSQIYLSVFKDYANFEGFRSDFKRNIENANVKYQENIKLDKFFWEALRKETEYGFGPAKQMIMKLLFK